MWPSTKATWPTPIRWGDEGRGNSFPQIPFVLFNPVLIQQGEKFFLKRQLAVMHLLSLDLFNDFVQCLISPAAILTMLKFPQRGQQTLQPPETYPMSLSVSQTGQLLFDRVAPQFLTSASTAGTRSHPGCFPDRVASCTGDQCRCQCRPPGACRVPAR